MTENMKKFLELVSKDEALVAKVNAADKNALIALAKELGVELTEADFEHPTELSDDELEVVAGGAGTWCILIGGGGNTKGTKCKDIGVGFWYDWFD